MATWLALANKQFIESVALANGCCLGARLRAQLREGVSTTELCSSTQISFNTKKLVVFSRSFRTTRCPSFNLANACSHCQVSNGEIFGLARTVTHHATITVLFRQIDGIQRFAQRPNLIWFDQDRVSNTRF